jgi:hypothetical protein
VKTPPLDSTDAHAATDGPRDSTGAVIPAHLRDAWFTETATANAQLAVLRGLKKAEWESRKTANKMIQGVIGRIENECRPFAVCFQCGGSDNLCTACGGCGWLSKEQMKHLDMAMEARA